MEISTKEKLSDLVAESIINFIEKNRLSPGDRLPTEKVIAETLNIGRTSVREGLGRLMAMGLLESRQGYGVVLREVTVDTLFSKDNRFELSRFLHMGRAEILDVLELRRALETFGFRQAVANVTEEDLAELEDMAKQMADSVDSPDVYSALDFEFHSRIMRIGRNSILPRVYEFTSDLIRKQFGITILQPNALRRATRAHFEILAALQKRDAEACVAAIEGHLEDVEQMAEAAFPEEPGPRTQQKA